MNAPANTDLLPYCCLVAALFFVLLDQLLFECDVELADALRLLRAIGIDEGDKFVERQRFAQFFDRIAGRALHQEESSLEVRTMEYCFVSARAFSRSMAPVALVDLMCLLLTGSIASRRRRSIDCASGQLRRNARL